MGDTITTQFVDGVVPVKPGAVLHVNGRRAHEVARAILLVAVAALGPAVPRRALAQSAPSQPPSGTVAPTRKLELSAFGGWATNSDVHGGGTLAIGDATSWGASVGVDLPHGSLVELRWIYQNPSVQIHGLGNSDKFHVPTNYFLVGGEKGFPRERLEPFLEGSLGAVVYIPESFNVGFTHYSPGTTWRMAFGLGGGLKVFLTPRVALRLTAEMLAPILFSGGGFYVGTGGSGVSVSGGVPTVTGNFTVGITIRP
jgi:hypothetical protein